MWRLRIEKETHQAASSPKSRASKRELGMTTSYSGAFLNYLAMNVNEKIMTSITTLKHRETSIDPAEYCGYDMCDVCEVNSCHDDTLIDAGFGKHICSSCNADKKHEEQLIEFPECWGDLLQDEFNHFDGKSGRHKGHTTTGLAIRDALHTIVCNESLSPSQCIEVIESLKPELDKLVHKIEL